MAAAPPIVAFAVGTLAIGLGRAPGQEEPKAPLVDLMDPPGADLRIGAYLPRVPPQVRCLRSDDDAVQFATAAWGTRNDALHVDYTTQQIVVVAWGALRFAEDSNGPGLDILLERATIDGDTLRATVRTVLPPGPGIDIPADAHGRTGYPSLFFRTPRTARVVLDVIGARRHGDAPDFRPVTESDLEVRIGPDACPARERLALVPLPEAASTPTIRLRERDGGQVLEVAWGELGPGSYRLECVGMAIDRGTARLTLRAENRAILFYSGPGVHRPGLALRLPPVDRVLLQIERTGLPLPPDQTDFTPSTDARLTVGIDDSLLRKGR